MILCECGEIIEGNTFKDYIKTSANPSTPTIGHEKCGHIFNFIDQKQSKKYSSKIELKTLSMVFAKKNNFDTEKIERFLLEVDKLKSTGNLPDNEIIIKAFYNVM
ncbi:hypothetical protein METP2_02294 [Methanosarcinales archaeon]|uniref:hypothetical protein n=1 Tax=Candidatus Methanoperedens sp. BLZ2 TaxID=2035255 RepID=UPI000BE301CA|nr:hypothetical protein [Candidatus Methanoperedens sp. BLZ2]KAB2944609.1 MAG: hypothetical protein F9K14_14055 [Candidatus Methanoperedens sp.]MBZ0176876.1 hypothetical protein [Candidatus Methanoperedens nitroreducens]CAG0986254.1 hypothetical protein METP2_02294 [Methanosarcinales archaeon]MCX9077108.1 hypothetical protein [Candidatus Methanoperedens sp.]MCX9086559.1 hypothetical protein [Candidatus Methanoperedens sp.]